MNIGILGAGNIAEMMAKTLAGIPNKAAKYAVASRSYEKADEFAKKHGFEKAYGSYEEMAEDPAVDLIYVATPHSHHFEHMKICIERGKPVLCEKAFTMNAQQAKEIISLAREKKVYLAEAIWTRYMPSRRIIDDAIKSGIIGEVTAMSANLCYSLRHIERMMRPELAGGALLDLGVYTLNFALMHFGNDIEKIDTVVQKADTGVDTHETIVLTYRDGRMATLVSGFLSRSDRKGIFYGTKGYIIVENINDPQSVTAYDTDDNLLKEFPVPPQITGYEYEVLESMEKIKEGGLEPLSMPHDDIIEVMELMDSIRKMWGFKYPGE